MRFLILIVREHIGYIVLAALIGMAGGAANAWLIGQVNDELSALGAGGVDSPWLFLAMIAVVFVTSVLSEVILVSVSETLAHYLRIDVCGQILAMPIAETERFGKASFITAFTQDIPTITIALLRIPAICINGAITLGCLIYLGFLSPLILAVLFIFLVLSLTSYLVPERRALHYVREYRQAWDGMLGDFDAMNEGAKELKLHHERRQRFYDTTVRQSSEQLRRTGYIHRLVYAIIINWTKLFFFVFIAILIYAIPDQVRVDLKTVTGFAIVVLYLVGPLTQLVNAVPRFRAASVAFEKARRLGLELGTGSDGTRLFETGTELAELADLGATTSFNEIVLEGVTHTYYREREDHNFTLGPVDLTIRAGELIFLLGGNGSGKTTLAKLLTGLYIPESGTIALDGVPVEEHNRERYRQHFSAIFSDFYVFEQLIGVAGDELDEQARHYLEMLHLDNKVSVEAGRLSTTELSSGQRKRLALMAAYLEDRPVYLFDEWASDQDPEFKRIFYYELLPELKARGKTIIAITHDDRYFAVADRLVQLADGHLESAPATVYSGESSASS